MVDAAVFYDAEGNHVCFCGRPAALKVIDCTDRDPFTGDVKPYAMWLCGFHVAQHVWEGAERAKEASRG